MDSAHWVKWLFSAVLICFALYYLLLVLGLGWF
jgi:hypothetical protein